MAFEQDIVREDESQSSLETRLFATGTTWWIVGIAGAIVGGLLLFFAPPAGQIFYPRCQLYEWTGLWCPGCGTMRAGHHVLHGRFGEAYRHNALILWIGGALTLIALRWWKAGRISDWLARSEPWILLAGAATGFGIARNLTGWHL